MQLTHDSPYQSGSSERLLLQLLQGPVAAVLTVNASFLLNVTQTEKEIQQKITQALSHANKLSCCNAASTHMPLVPMVPLVPMLPLVPMVSWRPQKVFQQYHATLRRQTSMAFATSLTAF